MRRVRQSWQRVWRGVVGVAFLLVIGVGCEEKTPIRLDGEAMPADVNDCQPVDDAATQSNAPDTDVPAQVIPENAWVGKMVPPDADE